MTLSGSAVDQLDTCSLQWLLAREVRAETPSTSAQGFGNVLHVLADEVASGRTPADLGVLMERLDSVWDAMAFDAPWKSLQEKAAAREALERFLRWHVAERGREPVATEHPFDVTLAVGDVQVRIRGSMDRVERDADGLAYVVDFKTGKGKASGKELARHPQLAVYQLAIREGAAASIEGPDGPVFGEDGAAVPGGAELVQLRQEPPGKAAESGLPLVQIQEAPQDQWVEELLARTAGRVLAERFVPTTGKQCEHCSFHRSCSARPEGRQIVE